MTEHFGGKHMLGRRFTQQGRRAVAIAAFGLLGAIGAAQAADLDQKMQVCGACHATGAGGAPKYGREADWASRLEKGMPALLESVRNGVPGTLMPGGLCGHCSDAEIEALVQRMSQTQN